MTSLHCNIAFSRGDFSLALGFTVSGTGVTALIGPSGCGKTTLLRAIAGLDRPQSGHIHLGKRIWFDANQRIFLKPQQRRIGFMFQNYALFPHMSVIDNIFYGAPENCQSYVLALIEKFQITDIKHCRPDRISGGQRQRVALARALAMKPDLLLLDEPFSSVDGCLRVHLRRMLLENAVETNIPVLMVTHDMDDVKAVAHWVGVMGAGCLSHFGTIDEVLK